MGNEKMENPTENERTFCKQKVTTLRLDSLRSCVTAKAFISNSRISPAMQSRSSSSTYCAAGQSFHSTQIRSGFLVSRAFCLLVGCCVPPLSTRPSAIVFLPRRAHFTPSTAASTAHTLTTHSNPLIRRPPEYEAL